MATVAEQYGIVEKEQPLLEKPKPISSTKKPAKLTLEQAEKLANGQPYELIAGRMIFKMPDDYHSRTQVLLGAELVNYLKTTPVGQVRSELTHRLWPENPHEGRVPDLSVLLNENLHFAGRYPKQAPDIAIEIISRDDAWAELFEKAELYFEKGSREVWFMDPYQKIALIVTPESRRWEKDELTSPELLPGFRVKLKDVFEWPAQSASVSPTEKEIPLK